MPDQTVTLTDMEWGATLSILGNAQGPGISWGVVNPLIMKIGQQLQAQQAESALPVPAFLRSNPGDGLDQSEDDSSDAMNRTMPRSDRRVPRA